MHPERYDFIVIGAGHNGLVTAAYLAKAGRKVLVLERRGIVGGSCVTEEFASGFSADAVWTGGHLRPGIIKDLGLSIAEPAAKPAFILRFGAASDEQLVIDADSQVAAEAIRRFSEKDAARWPEFVSFMNRAAQFLEGAYATIMPRLPRGMSLRAALGLAELGLDLRLLGGKDMLRVIRMLPMTALEFLEEWFEAEELKAALAAAAVHAVTLGPMSAGTGYVLLHNWMNRGGLAHRNVGRAGEITQALAQAVMRLGGEIRLEAEVRKILTQPYACRGVLLDSGEEIEAGAVISAVDPKRTLLSLVEPVNLPPEFVWHAQSIKLRGSVSKLHLLNQWATRHPGGHTRRCAIRALPRASLRRGQVWRYLGEALPGADHAWESGERPRAIHALRLEGLQLGGPAHERRAPRSGYIVSVLP